VTFARVFADCAAQRWLEALDVGPLVNVICRFRTLCLEVGTLLKTVDVNPLLVQATGTVIPVDSLCELR
jgi:hypothetical protein